MLREWIAGNTQWMVPNWLIAYAMLSIVVGIFFFVFALRGGWGGDAFEDFWMSAGASIGLVFVWPLFVIGVTYKMIKNQYREYYYARRRRRGVEP